LQAGTSGKEGVMADRLPGGISAGVRVLHPNGTTQIFGPGEVLEVHCGMRRFVLDRLSDESGVSGTGFVAEGVEFTDGTVALRWNSDLTSTAIYSNIQDVDMIHGHNGQTQIRWVDNE
jgi:hypothetical protein